MSRPSKIYVVVNSDVRTEEFIAAFINKSQCVEWLIDRDVDQDTDWYVLIARNGGGLLETDGAPRAYDFIHGV